MSDSAPDAPRVAPRIAFESPEELSALLAQIAARLHWANRVGLGEQGYAADLAGLIDRIGRDMVPLLKDRATTEDFGAAYIPARLSRAAQTERLKALAFP